MIRQNPRTGVDLPGLTEMVSALCVRDGVVWVRIDIQLSWSLGVL